MTNEDIRVRSDVTLRLIQTTDASELFRVVDVERERLRRTLPWLDATTTQEDMHKFTLDSAHQCSIGYARRYAIVYQGKVVGVASLERMDGTEARIGYWLAEGSEGLGIVSDCVNKIVAFAFGTLHLKRIEIAASVENSKSMAVALRTGFVFKEILPKAECLYGRYVDHALFEKVQDFK